MNAVVDKNAETQARRLARWGIKRLPGIDLLPDDGQAWLEEQALKFVRGNPDAAGKLKEANSWWDNLMNSFQDLVLGFIDSKSLTARNEMLAKIGLDAKGQANGQNPFAEIDKKLGIDVSTELQSVAEKAIREEATGWFGLSKSNATKAVFAMQEPAEKAIYKALRDKYGTKSNEKELQDIAANAAKAVIGVDDTILTSEDPAHWLAQTPPDKGIAGMLMRTALSENKTVAAMSIESTPLNQAVTQLAVLQNPQLLADAQRAADAAAKAKPRQTPVVGGTNVPGNSPPGNTPPAATKAPPTPAPAKV